MTMNTAQFVTSIVSLLGGPELNAEDIEWALGIPAGQRLLEWIVSQAVQQNANDATTDADALRVALQAISLEEDELCKLRRVTAVSRPATDQLALECKYIPPARLRTKEQSLIDEANLLESQAEVLKARLQQSKVASQNLAKAIKCIASEIEALDDDILASENNLSDLSLNADTVIQNSVKSSLGLLDACVRNSDSLEEDSCLSTLLSTRTSIVDRFHSQLRAIDTAAARLPTTEELQVECARLDAALYTPRAGGECLAAMGAAAAFDCEIAHLCEKLKNDPDAVSALVAQESKQNQHAQTPPSVKIDVATQVQAAWAHDQAAILEARGAVLDEVIAEFSDTLLPSLTSLEENLSARNAHLREAQALIGSLQEEIHDIVEDVQCAPQHQPQSDGETEAAADAELQAGLVKLLKQLKDFRPRDAPPLVLLSQEDILCELRAVYERQEISRHEEEAWAANLLPTLRSLEAAHAPLLNAVYADSAVNTSPPFARCVDIQAAYADAKAKADDLEGAINKLQEETKTLTNDRGKRLLDNFVAKWAK
ncbi:hypothetical protein GGX14DRAFT_666027 [Mycena pura]|uniref:Uncharacterized protein n=1 Tax=Mycena pura TaxID=153505 RepID=A0AAD6Y2X6_9AGAR|nr:hypothetical protein GGX14DRAFT_666027 [Mycena pura]